MHREQRGVDTIANGHTWVGEALEWVVPRQLCDTVGREGVLHWVVLKGTGLEPPQFRTQTRRSARSSAPGVAHSNASRSPSEVRS